MEDQAICGRRKMKPSQQPPKFVLCIRNKGSEDLEIRKVYQVLPEVPLRGTGTCV